MHNSHFVKFSWSFKDNYSSNVFSFLITFRSCRNTLISFGLQYKLACKYTTETKPRVAGVKADDLEGVQDAKIKF